MAAVCVCGVPCTSLSEEARKESESKKAVPPTRSFTQAYVKEAQKIEEAIVAECCAIEQEIEEDIILPLRDTAARYSAYAHFLAYASDVGESFRSVLPPAAVTATYGIAGMYMIGDIAYAGYAESQKPGTTSSHIGKTVAHSTVFQGLASLSLPFLVIHNAVHLSEKHIFKTMQNAFLKRWGPSAVALAIIPALPIADEPIEKFIDWVFDHRVRTSSRAPKPTPAPCSA